MGLQFVIRAADAADIHRALADAAPHCEVFAIRAGHFGLSIPSKVIASVGETVIQSRLAALDRFDLWAGVWKER